MAGFEIGDIVRLKSGGPKMTVYAVSSATSLFDLVWPDPKKYYCEWFAWGTLQHEYFGPGELDLVSDDEIEDDDKDDAEDEDEMEDKDETEDDE